MSSISFSQSRTTSQLSSNNLLDAVRKTQLALQQVQRQISTGKLLDKPSDNPTRTSAVLALESQIQAREQHERNLQHASGVLNTTDAALGDASTILLETRSIASDQVGITSNADTRKSEAVVIDQQLQAVIELANRQYQGVSLFAGNHTTDRNDPIFVPFLGGVRYLGGTTNLAADVGANNVLGFNANGIDAFGALSTRVKSNNDLDPLATPQTRLSDVGGAIGEGVRLGSVRVLVDNQETVVNLKGSNTLQDITTRINNAIAAIDPNAGGLAVSDHGFELTSSGSSEISITEIGAGQVAADLGIAISAQPGAIVAGGDLNVRLTALTQLSALGQSVDFAGGLKITQGSQTKIADFSGAQTVQDLQNVVDQLNLGLRLEINDSGTGLNLFTDVSGVELSVGENGGTTAADLGIRTFHTETLLSDLRHGLGVEPVLGEDDFELQLHDGSTFSVNADGIATIGELIDRIKQSATDAGLSAGDPGDAASQINIGLAPDGNGLYFQDNTAGSEDFRVNQLGTSLVATQLGIYQNAGADSSLTGEDVAAVKVESVFTHLIELRDSLINDDSSGITLAGGHIEHDIEILARSRADIGGRAKSVEQNLERSELLMISEKDLLSQIVDTDLTEAITRFTQLQQQLQASLQLASLGNQLSLLNFLG